MYALTANLNLGRFHCCCLGMKETKHFGVSNQRDGKNAPPKFLMTDAERSPPAGSVKAVLAYLVGFDVGLRVELARRSGRLSLTSLREVCFSGWFLTVTQSRLPIFDTLKLAIGTGFVGAYTTFSTYMYESNDLLRKGSELAATVSIGKHCCGLAGCAAWRLVGGRLRSS